ncbi:D-hexose-6-phosphate mutarotase [Microvirga sp. W0021]|uniref:Putative glucose-6-phosphate 1-epimerase n=1 Tax=Hohaiivirga grylli TaxID=3133970 RepID=A0ABV0BHF7_9HYPH
MLIPSSIPTIRITSPEGDEATVSLFGAHVLSWKTADGQEELYLSEHADFSRNKAIRGGIPICFPQFADHGPGNFHGFARTMMWHYVDDGKPSQARFRLSATEETLSLWPHLFQVELLVALTENQLSVMLQVTNTGQKDFEFTAALHSYFRISDIAHAKINNLSGTSYLDKIDSLTNQIETRQAITFSGACDRIYYDAPDTLYLHDQKRQLLIQSKNMPDTVLWNPGHEGSMKMADMPDEDYKFMVCVEAGQIKSAITLKPNETWAGYQIITAL